MVKRNRLNSGISAKREEKERIMTYSGKEIQNHFDELMYQILYKNQKEKSKP